MEGSLTARSLYSWVRGLGRKATGEMDGLDGGGTDKALKAGENFRVLWHQWETTERF